MIIFKTLPPAFGVDVINVSSLNIAQYGQYFPRFSYFTLIPLHCEISQQNMNLDKFGEMDTQMNKDERCVITE